MDSSLKFFLGTELHCATGLSSKPSLHVLKVSPTRKLQCMQRLSFSGSPSELISGVAEDSAIVVVMGFPPGWGIRSQVRTLMWEAILSAYYPLITLIKAICCRGDCR